MQKYSQMSRLLHQALNKKSSLKSIVINSSQNQQFIRQAYALLHKAITHYENLMKIIDDLLIKQYTDIKNKELMIILMLDMFNPENRKVKKMGGQVAKCLKENKQFIQEQLIKYEIYSNQQKNNKTIFIRLLNEESQIFNTQNELHLPNQKDSDIPDLYKVNYSDYSEYISKNKQFIFSNDHIVQSKSSALPAYLLLKDITNMKCDIIDCCSAPGNKTIQLSQYSKKNGIIGQIYAFEKDEKRFKILTNRLNKFSCTNVLPQHGDFLLTDPNDFTQVQIALLDPSCSGSGMLQQRLVEGIEQIDITIPKDKVKFVHSLAQMQSQMLDHLTNFKNLKLISYSTCSIYKEENEDVANQFLQKHKEWKSIKVYEQCDQRGINNEDFIRIKPGESDGFFIAVFKKRF